VSSLTEQERMGLEDVFLSISKSHKKSHKLDAFSHAKLYSKSWLQLRYATFKQFKVSQLIQKGLHISKISLYSAKLPKKKKNLS